MDGKLFYMARDQDSKQKKRVIIGETEKLEVSCTHFSHKNILLPNETLKVLRVAHEGFAGGNHYGIRNTYYKISNSYYWPRMYKDVLDYCNSCERCQQERSHSVHSPAVLHPILVSRTLSRRWGMDSIGPLKRTARGNQYIIVAVEYLSKWAVAKAVAERSADNAGEFLLDIVTSFGIPNMIIHDRGPEFNNLLFRKMCKVLKIKVAMASRYHPQTNGLAER
ncbi:hypothetical protein D918_08359 [Trichuris suis]|nr:hypothetical protein D918_08359 [Trichuris suis]